MTLVRLLQDIATANSGLAPLGCFQRAAVMQSKVLKKVMGGELVGNIAFSYR
jgi:hypothetical protein